MLGCRGECRVCAVETELISVVGRRKLDKCRISVCCRRIRVCRRVSVLSELVAWLCSCPCYSAVVKTSMNMHLQSWCVDGVMEKREKQEKEKMCRLFSLSHF